MSKTIINAPTSSIEASTSNRHYANDIIDAIVSIIISQASGRLEIDNTWTTGSGNTLTKFIRMKFTAGKGNNMFLQLESSTSGIIIFRQFRGTNSPVATTVAFPLTTEFHCINLPHYFAFGRASVGDVNPTHVFEIFHLTNNDYCFAFLTAFLIPWDAPTSSMFDVTWVSSMFYTNFASILSNGKVLLLPAFFQDTNNQNIPTRTIFEGFPIKTFLPSSGSYGNYQDYFLIDGKGFYRASQHLVMV